MTTYFWEDTATGTGVATNDAAPAITKAASGTATPTMVRQPQRTLSRAATATPVLVKQPQKTFTVVVATSIATKSISQFITKLASAILSTVLSTDRNGADSFAVINAERNWESTTEDRKWLVDAYSRFSYTVIGD